MAHFTFFNSGLQNSMGTAWAGR